MTSHEEAKSCYEALRHFLKELEHNLSEGEAICCVAAQFGQEFFVQNLIRNGPLISLTGPTRENRFERLVFSPGNLFFRFFTADSTLPSRKIGFEIERE